MFDAYLSARAESTGERFVPFDIDADYERYVDGKKREDGVRSFLDSRGIDLPQGDPDDDADTETVHGLGNRKNELFNQTLRSDGVEVFDGSRRYLKAVVDAGLAVAVVSSSANTREVLEITGLAEYVEVRVDGVTMREEGIAGKPAPDSFLRAAELLDAPADQAAVFEDALAGVAAGRAGNFGVVIGVDRVDHAEELRRNGADVVVTDLAELLGR
jgi:beta-phosphoglucomutase family hydrolase